MPTALKTWQAFRFRLPRYIRSITRRIRRLYKSPPSPPPLSVLNPCELQSNIPAALPAVPPDRFPNESLIPVLLFLLALIPRIYRISYPPSIVFDEIHFLRFTSAYYYRKYFFDIHPPLGKLVYLLATYLFCGAPPHKYEINGEQFGDQVYAPLRLTSALFGAAVSPICYLICRTLGLSFPASMVPAFIQAFEHLAIIESRLVLCDSQLMLFMALCLYFALKTWSAPPAKRTALVIATSASGAAALSVKWTALVTPALVAIISLSGYPFTKRRLSANLIVLAATVALFVYCGLFWIHFRTLIYSGIGDDFMQVSFQRTLLNSSNFVKKAKPDGFWYNFFYLNYRMYTANKGIKARHHWESPWWQWIINMRGILYYNELTAEDEWRIEKVYVVVNPMVTVITLLWIIISFNLCIGFVLRSIKSGKSAISSRISTTTRAFFARNFFFLCAYVLNIVPYLEVARCTFLYHYLPALFYALLGTGNLIDAIPSHRIKCVSSAVICGLVFLAFIVWSPWIYATPLSPLAHQWRHLYGEHWN